MFYLLFILVLPVVAFLCCLIAFRSTIKQNWHYFALPAAITLLFLVRFLDNSTTIIQKDANLLQIPFLMSYRDSILNFSQPPLWNPYLWSGTANLAHPLAHVFHPLMFLALLMPIYPAFNLIVGLNIFLCAAFMFLLVKELGQAGGVALVAAVVYAFNEFTLDRLGALTGPGVEYLYSYAVLPLAMALLLRALKTKSYYYAVLFGTALVFIFAGNANLLYYSVFMFALVIGYALVTAPSRSNVVFQLTCLPLGLLVFALVGAVELIPFIEFQQVTADNRLHNAVSGYRMLGISLGSLSWQLELAGLFFAPHQKPASGLRYPGGFYRAAAGGAVTPAVTRQR